MCTCRRSTSFSFFKSFSILLVCSSLVPCAQQNTIINTPRILKYHLKIRKLTWNNDILRKNIALEPKYRSQNKFIKRRSARNRILLNRLTLLYSHRPMVFQLFQIYLLQSKTCKNSSNSSILRRKFGKFKKKIRRKSDANSGYWYWKPLNWSAI